MNAFWMSLTIAWNVLVWGLSSRPEMSICGGDFLPGDVLHDLGDAGDDLLVELPHRALIAVLRRVVGLHILEERLHPAPDLAVLHGELRVEGEHPGDDVELAVGPQHVVHRPEVGVLDRHPHVEVRAVHLRPEVGRHLGRAAPHEAAVEGRRHLPLGALVGEVLEPEARDVDEGAVVGGRALVEEADPAVDELDAPRAEQRSGALLASLDRLDGLAGGLLGDFGGGRLRGLDVLDLHPADRRLLEVGDPDGGAVLEGARRGQGPALRWRRCRGSAPA